MSKSKVVAKKAKISAPEYPKQQLVFSSENAGSKVPVLSFVFSPEKDGKEPDFKVEHPYYNGDAQDICQSGTHWYAGLGNVKALDLDSLGEYFVSALKKCGPVFSELQLEIPAELLKKFSPEQVANLLAVAAAVTSFPTDLLKGEKSKQKFKLSKIFLHESLRKNSAFMNHLNYYSVIGKHINGMRQTQALPGNVLTPETMEQRVKQIAAGQKIKAMVFDKASLEKLGAGGILAVSQGSALEPRMLVLDYAPPGAKKTLAIIGKGVTFDTGGISLKPASEMHEMKYDMSGSAAAVHAIAAIAELKVPVRVVCAVGMVENMPGPSAFKPGDVYTSLKGLTVEVQNTDAEGRLVLADLLHYAEKNYKPDLMIDLATLTGACVVALGNFYAGLFSSTEAVKNLVLQAAQASAEPVWPLPMGRLYKDLLKSDIADYNNIGGRWGGACSAASFLSAFVDEKTPWAHLDIAGIGMINKNFNVYTAGGSGYGIRLLVKIAEQLSAQKGELK